MMASTRASAATPRRPHAQDIDAAGPSQEDQRQVDDPFAIDTVTGWADDDRDGWGRLAYDGSEIRRCDPAAVADVSGDCDDQDPDVAFEGWAPHAALLDLDRDGALDLATSTSEGGRDRVEVRYGPVGSGPAIAWDAEGTVFGLQAAGDVDGDGTDELLVKLGRTSWLVEGMSCRGWCRGQVPCT